MSRTAGITFAALLLAVVVSAQDSEFRLFGTTATYYEDHQPDDMNNNYTKIKQILSLNIAWSHITAGAQLEYLDYSDNVLVDPQDLDRLHDELELRKYYIEYLNDSIQARLGTFYASFGHGLTLFVQRNDALKFDEPIHGVTATASLGRFEITALGGTVTEPKLENQYGSRFEDEIRAGRVLVNLPHDIYLGASFVAATMDNSFQGGDDDEVDVWAIEGGGDVAGIFDFHGEWAELDSQEMFGSQIINQEGYGRYLSVNSSFGPITILGELKDYWNFAYRYNTPPNAGRLVEVYDHDDIKGARLRIDGDIMATGTLLYASYAEFDTHSGGEAQTEWYVGLEESVGPLYGEAVYFNRRHTDRDILEDHITADLHVTTGDRGEISLGYDRRYEKTESLRIADHRSFISYSWAPYGTLSVRYAWKESRSTSTEGFWGSELEFTPKPVLTFAIFVGAEPGGLVCSGGQCREEPQFKGFKTRLTWRF